MNDADKKALIDQITAGPVANLERRQSKLLTAYHNASADLRAQYVLRMAEHFLSFEYDLDAGELDPDTIAVSNSIFDATIVPAKFAYPNARRTFGLAEGVKEPVQAETFSLKLCLLGEIDICVASLMQIESITDAISAVNTGDGFERFAEMVDDPVVRSAIEHVFNNRTSAGHTKH